MKTAWKSQVFRFASWKLNSVDVRQGRQVCDDHMNELPKSEIPYIHVDVTHLTPLLPSDTQTDSARTRHFTPEETKTKQREAEELGKRRHLHSSMPCIGEMLLWIFVVVVGVSMCTYLFIFTFSIA